MNKILRGGIQDKIKFFLSVVLILFFIAPNFIFLTQVAYAAGTIYYVDSSITDTNVGSATPDCTTYNPSTFSCSGGSASAYKTIADVNAKTFSPDDQILFRKGQTWREQLTVSSSGTSGHPITFGSFGSGAKPIISGANLITSWSGVTLPGGTENFTDGSGSKPQGYWAMTEVSGSRADGNTTNNNTLSESSTISRVTGPNSQVPYAANFVAASSQVLTRTDGNLSAGFPGKSGVADTSVTFGAWVKVSNYNGTSVGIMQKQFSYQLTINAFGGPYADILDDSYGFHDVSGGLVPVNTWTHLAVRWNQGTGSIRIFVNGADVTSGTVTSATMVQDGGGPLRIGDSLDGYMNGAIAEPFVFAEALTDAQIGDIYNGGLSGLAASSGYSASSASAVTQLFVDDSRLQMSRWPNTGYQTITTTSGDQLSLVSTALTQADDYWIGSKAVIKDEVWSIKTKTITDSTQSTHTINWASDVYHPIDTPTQNYGFYIEGNCNQIDIDGEWCYNSSDNKVYIKYATSPSSHVMEGAVRSQAINLNAKSYISIQDFQLEKTSGNAIESNNVGNITINNVTILNSGGGIALYGDDTQQNIQITNNTITGTYELQGIAVEGFDTVTISGNTISSIANDIISPKDNSGILVGAGNSVISNNNISSAAGACILLSREKTNLTVSGNILSSCVNSVADMGGIYKFGGGSNINIFNNVVHDVQGTTAGTPGDGWIIVSPVGIYLDVGSTGVSVYGNLIYDINGWGIHLNSVGSGTNTIVNNTIYDVSFASIGAGGGSSGTEVIKNNILNTSDQYLLYNNSGGTLNADYNLFYNAGGYTNRWNLGGTDYSTFAAWKSASSQDAHSLNSDPLLTNPGSNIFTLQSGSPAIDSGLNLGSTYQLGLSPSSTWPSSVATLNQNSNGAGWEIGAYVFSVPTASSVAVTGTTTVGNTLTGSYTYSDLGGASEATSTFRWLRADTAGGTYTAIPLATASTYVLVSADAGKYIKFEVTPVSTLATGTAVLSSATAQIQSTSLPTASAVTITGTAETGQTLTGSYTYAQTDNVPEGTSTFRWLSSSTSGGTYTAISGATASTYVVASSDQGMYIKFEVTPVATSAPTTGVAVVSAATLQVPVPSSGSSGGSHHSSSRSSSSSSSTPIIPNVPTDCQGSYRFSPTTGLPCSNYVPGDTMCELGQLFSPTTGAQCTTFQTPTAPVFLSTIILTRNLYMPLRGDDVKILQEYLISKGFLAARNNTGYFGPLTKAAVILYQTSKGIPGTGYVGVLTRGALGK